MYGNSHHSPTWGGWSLKPPVLAMQSRLQLPRAAEEAWQPLRVCHQLQARRAALKLWWAPHKKIYIQTIHKPHWNNVERMLSMKSEHVRNELLWLCAVHAWLWQHDTECNFHRQTICITSCQVLSLASAEISAGALRSCLSSLPSELKAGKRLELLPNCLTTVCRI